MSRRLALARSRFAVLRLLMLLAGAAVLSLFVYWRGLKSSQNQSQINIPWERSAALHKNEELYDEDYDDGDLVADGVTTSPEETTMEFDIDRQLQKDVMEFGDQLKDLGVPVVETEDRHIGVEQRQLQPWEMEVEDLFDDSKDYDDDDLVEDDHVPGLVEDTGSRHSSDAHMTIHGAIEHTSKHKHKAHEEDEEKHTKDSLLEEELEAVARLAMEDAMKDAEEEEWAKLADVEEAEEWKHEADVDWDKEEEELIQETKKQKKIETDGKRRKTERKEKASKNKRGDKILLDKDEDIEYEEDDVLEDDLLEDDVLKDDILKDDELEEDELDEETTTQEMTTFEMTTQQSEREPTTIETTTPEPQEKVDEEEAEEADIFGAPETRKIERILLKLGIGKNRRLRYALEKTANWKRNILITLSDSRYTMLTLNFYENTVLKLGMKNVLFASLDGKLCAKLEALNIPCFLYARTEITRSDYERGFRKIFNSKMYYRMKLILESLAMGYNVAYVDVDTMLQKDPFPALAEECHGKCDVAFQQMTNMTRQLSWGVAYTRPTLGSLYLYYSLVKKTANCSNVALPDKFINRLDRERKLHLVRLPLWRFRSGIDYFDYVKFGWDDKCIGCVSVHSDETHSKDAKLFRMKELLMWNLNMEGYYSNRRRRYIVYDNPYVFHNGTETLIMEMRALRNALALGHILRRVVILPKFHCFVPPALPGEPEPGPPSTKWCNMHDILRIEDFHKWFMGHYREHSFLAHRKVPRTTKRNISAVYYIGHKLPEVQNEYGQPIDAVNITMIKPKSAIYGAHAEEIRALFEHENALILRLHSLYYGFSHFLSDDVARGFNRKIKFGFVFRTRVRYNVKNLKVKAPETPNQQYGGPNLGPPGGPLMPGAPMMAPPGHMLAQTQILIGQRKAGEKGPLMGQAPIDQEKLAAFQAQQKIAMAKPAQGQLQPAGGPTAAKGFMAGIDNMDNLGRNAGQMAQAEHAPPQHLMHRPPDMPSDTAPPQPPATADMFLPPPAPPKQPEDTGMFMPPPPHAPPKQPEDNGMFMPLPPKDDEAPEKSEMFLPPADEPLDEPEQGESEGFLVEKR